MPSSHHHNERLSLIELDEKLNVPAGRVQVVIQPLLDLSSDPFLQRIEAIWAGQRARGHIPRTVEEVEGQRQAFRQEMEDELQGIMKLQEECREARKHAQGPQETGE